MGHKKVIRENPAVTLTAEEEKKRARRKATRLKKIEAARIEKLELVTRSLGMTGIIKPSHALSLPELRDILHPNEDVPFIFLTLKVEDEPSSLALVDIIVKGKIFTIDLAKLELSKKNQNILLDSGILPQGYFKKNKKNSSETRQGEYVDPGMLCHGYEEEYYPTSSPN